VLSSPSTTRGGNFTIEPLSWTRHERFAFRYEKEIIFLEAGVRIPEVLASQDNLRGIMNNSEKEKKPGSGNGVQTDDPKNLSIKDEEKFIEISANTESADEKEVEFSEPLPAVTNPLVQKHQLPPEATSLETDVLTTEKVDAEDTPVSRDNADLILDIPIVLTAVLGRTKKKIDEVLRLGEGSVVELSKLDGEPIDILANKTLIARGEVIVDKEKYGIRIIEIIEKMKRIESLR